MATEICSPFVKSFVTLLKLFPQLEKQASQSVLSRLDQEGGPYYPGPQPKNGNRITEMKMATAASKTDDRLLYVDLLTLNK